MAEDASEHSLFRIEPFHCRFYSVEQGRFDWTVSQLKRRNFRSHRCSSVRLHRSRSPSEVRAIRRRARNLRVVRARQSNNYSQLKNSKKRHVVRRIMILIGSSYVLGALNSMNFYVTCTIKLFRVVR